VSRLLAIGLDAASWPLLRRLARRGLVPNIAELAARGRLVTVHGSSAYRAELAWTTFLAGAGPTRTGYWGTVRFDPRSYRAWEDGAHRFAPFYAPLDGVVAFDVPHVAPWPGVAGVQLSGWGAHSPQVEAASLPAAVLADVVANHGLHPRLEADSEPIWHRPGCHAALARDLMRGIGVRAAVFDELIGRLPGWRLAITVFSETHSAGHHLWHGVDPAHPAAAEPGAASAGDWFVQIHRALDEAIGALVHRHAPAGDDVAVALFSPHDMTINASDLAAQYFVPELLARLQGAAPTLRRQPGPPDPSLARPDPDESLARAFERRHVPEAALGRRMLRSAARRLAELHGAGGPAAPDGSSPGSWPRPLDYLGAMRHRAWWPSSRAFALPSFSDAQLRVNLRGRESNGVVAPQDYAAELDRWETELRAVRDGRTGSTVVRDVTRPRAGDPTAAGGPPADLVVRFGPATDRVEHPKLGTIGPLPFLRTGEHGDRGFVLLAGRRVDAAPAEIDLADAASLLVPRP